MNQTDHLLGRLARLNQIGVALSAESNNYQLLDMILSGAREMTGADAGTIYTLKDDFLHFEIVQTQSLGLALRGGERQIPLYDNQGRPNNLVAVQTVLRGQVIRLADVYRAEGFDFSGTRQFDAQFGYRSTSFLSVPLKNHEEDVIGVLQLINAIDSETGEIRSFSDEDQLFAASLASQAAVTMTKNQLIGDMKNLFESLIQMIASAIDEKSPYTGDHCRRVPVLTMLLAQALNETSLPPFADFFLEEKDIYELEVAAWLHDCGKLITPVHVVDKATKLEAIHDRFELVKTRFEVIRRDLEIARLRGGVNSGEIAVDAREEWAQQWRPDLEFLAACNPGNEYLAPEAQQRISAIAEQYFWFDQQGEQCPVLTADETMNLQVARGTLNDAEREIINRHIVSTINMLGRLPFPKQLARVPEIAGGHHERCDGKGYPTGLTAEQLSVQTRILAIADIFEALTARDRPYKKGKTLSMALGIMQQMVRQGHIDGDLFRVFVAEKVYLLYGQEHLSPDQLDEVDPASFL